MGKRTNQNSILFLTTLGVYLGLVLVGATPQAFGQATPASTGEGRTTRTEDGLYPQVNFDDSVVVYLQDVESFLVDLQKLRDRQAVDLRTALFNVAQSSQLPCVPGNQAGSYTAEKFTTTVEALRPLLERYTKVFTDGYALSDCLSTDRFSDLTATHSRFEVKADIDGLSISVSAKKGSPSRAFELAQLLRPTFQKYRQNTTRSLRDQLVTATVIAAQNDQIFVITHLPRAGLIALLSKRA